MKRSQKSANPFYILLVAIGLAFFVTATAYGVMAFREVRAAAAEESATAEHPLMTWMRSHGEATLAVELGLLGVCTFGAIATDGFWQRRATNERKRID